MTTITTCIYTIAIAAAVEFFSFAAEPPATTPAKLADESSRYCKETSCSCCPLTPYMVIKKVNEAATLISREGEKAFVKFRGRDCPFIFCGTYIWVHDTAGIMRMHPMLYKLEGMRMLNIKDTSGKMFLLEMNLIAREKGEGWVEYTWPKPGTDIPVKKVSYVKLTKYKDREYIVGCGIYETTLQQVITDINKPLPRQPGGPETPHPALHSSAVPDK